MNHEQQAALIRIVKAWEALPEGYYSQQAMQSWITNSLAPAIRECRLAIPEELRSRVTREGLQREQ
jgi:hypothetical protein